MELRLRWKHTKIANPIAASAAATVSTNMVKTWPVRSPRCTEKAIRFAVEENPEHADDEQSRRHCQMVFKPDHDWLLPFGLRSFISTDLAGSL